MAARDLIGQTSQIGERGGADELDLAQGVAEAAVEDFGFCNELGVNGTVRFLKNISGLWLIQECKRQWALEGDDLDYPALAELAEESEPFTSFIDPDAPDFAAGRRLIRNSFEFTTYLPRDTANWEAAYQRFGEIL